MPALTCAGLVLLGGSRPSAGAGTSAQVVLAPHMAVYDLELARATHRSGLVNVRGRIAMSLGGDRCSGWTNELRMVNDYYFRRRGRRLIDTRTTSWEAPDGSTYRYTSVRRVNGVKSRETVLSAERKGADGVTVTFSRPHGRKTVLPGETLFPAQATRRMISAARSSRKALRFLVYEGFEDGRARLVSVVFGSEIRPGQGKTAAPAMEREAAPVERRAGHIRKEAAVSPLLQGRRAWPVSMAYYRISGTPAGKEENFGIPEYEISFTLYENGILADPVLHYDEFTLKGRLVRLEGRKSPDSASCR